MHTQDECLESVNHDCKRPRTHLAMVTLLPGVMATSAPVPARNFVSCSFYESRGLW